MNIDQTKMCVEGVRIEIGNCMSGIRKISQATCGEPFLCQFPSRFDLSIVEMIPWIVGRDVGIEPKAHGLNDIQFGPIHPFQRDIEYRVMH